MLSNTLRSLQSYVYLDCIDFPLTAAQAICMFINSEVRKFKLHLFEVKATDNWPFSHA